MAVCADLRPRRSPVLFGVSLRVRDSASARLDLPTGSILPPTDGMSRRYAVTLPVHALRSFLMVGYRPTCAFHSPHCRPSREHRPPVSFRMPSMRRGAVASRASPRLPAKAGPPRPDGLGSASARSPSPSLRHRDRQRGGLRKRRTDIMPAPNNAVLQIRQVKAYSSDSRNRSEL